jgi:hypothetical protein
VYISGEEARVPAPLLRAVALLCEGRWIVEGLTQASSGLPMIDFHLAGSGMEAALCAAVEGGGLLLMYRPDGRAALDAVFDVVRLTRSEAARLPSRPVPVSMDTLADEPGWDSRILQAVSVSQLGSSPPREVAWLRIRDRLFLLEPGDASIVARPVDEDGLRRTLESVGSACPGLEPD